MLPGLTARLKHTFFARDGQPADAALRQSPEQGSSLSARVRMCLLVLVALTLTLMLTRDNPRSPVVHTVVRSLSPLLNPFLAELEERTFRFFWDTANRKNGLIPDRYPAQSFASIAAVGFGLTAYPIGVERGYIKREEARQRVLTTLRFFHDAPQNPSVRGTIGYKGFFYHFLDMKSGDRFGDTELSTVDTALFLAGALFCQAYFDGSQPEEVEIRNLAEEIYRRVDWQWAQTRPPAISHGWTPEDGFLEYDWRGYNEAMLVYVLALGSPTYPVGPDAWQEWTSTYDKSWRKLFGQEYLGFPPLFGHQFTHVWLDLRKVQDAYMRRRGLDYFENSRRAIYAQQAYAVANPLHCKGYGETIWGITASDGPGEVDSEAASGRRARRRRNGWLRRLHPGADRRGGFDSVRSRSCDPGGTRNESPLRPLHLLDLRLSRCVQLELRPNRSGEPWSCRRRLRLGRRRLYRHRSGSHLRHDRKLSQRTPLETVYADPGGAVGTARPRVQQSLSRVNSSLSLLAVSALSTECDVDELQGRGISL